MDLTIDSGGDEEALQQFYRWLREDVDVVRSSSISAAGSQQSGHMGAFEVICMSVGSLTGLASLGISWASFFRSRTDKPPFTITVVGTLSDEQLEMIKKLDLPLAGNSSGAE